MPEGLDPYQELVWQLARLPGGATAAIPDFFGSLLAEPVEPARWRFKSGGRLILDDEHTLRYDETTITHLPAALLAAAEAAAIPPLLLALLALSTGQIDGDRRLKQVHSKLDAAAKDLMLMSVCRLCG